MSHTPTPWKQGYKDNQCIYADYKNVAVVQCKEKEWQANAEFIVRAVNAHDELVLAAKDACIHIRELAETLNADYRNNSTFKRLLDAIAKAEGK